MKNLRIMAVMAFAIGAVAVNWATPAAAGRPGGLYLAPTSNHTQLELTFSSSGDVDCDNVESYSVREGGLGGPVVSGVTVTPDPTDPMTGTILLPDSVPGGEYTFVLTCDGQQTLDANFAFGRGIITKNVVGDAPADASFVVNVACDHFETPDFAVDRTFPAAGGTQHVIVYGPTECTVTETDDGGAESSSIDKPALDLASPGDDTVVVTNTFAEANDEQPDPGPGDEPGTPRGDDPLDESAPAAPVKAKPALTG